MHRFVATARVPHDFVDVCEVLIVEGASLLEGVLGPPPTAGRYEFRRPTRFRRHRSAVVVPSALQVESRRWAQWAFTTDARLAAVLHTRDEAVLHVTSLACGVAPLTELSVTFPKRRARMFCRSQRRRTEARHRLLHALAAAIDSRLDGCTVPTPRVADVLEAELLVPRSQGDDKSPSRNGDAR
jgi:hypothetical protein